MKHAANALLVLVSTIVVYALLEVAFYFALCFGLAVPAHPYFNFVTFSNPKFFVNDPVIGWRFNPGQPNSSIRVSYGEVQYSALDVVGNAAGFHSRLEYTPKRGRPYRVAVYGDSYTAMQYQNRPWPDRLHDVLAEAGVEVYGFGFDGGGLTNWHLHYFHELVPRYEFDMVVFAVCCDDLRRGFTIWETRPDGGYLARFPKPPADAADYAANYLPKLGKLVPMTDRSVIQKLRTHFSRNDLMLLPFDLYLLRTAQIAIRQFRTPETRVPASALRAAPSGPLDNRLEEMASDLRRRGKAAVLLLLPWHTGLDLPQSAELAEVAKRSCLHFVDGFDLFKDDPAARQAYPYRPTWDAHWLEPASDRFAELLGPKIQQVKDAAAPRCADGG